MAEYIDVAGAEIRTEWKELNAVPAHPNCPIVKDLDIAHTTIENAVGAGIIDAETAQRRIGAINLRRLVITNAQAEYGCRGVCDGEAADEYFEAGQPKAEPGKLAPDLICDLPVGRVEAYAFGGSMEFSQTPVTVQTKGIGF
mgnify:CR=1 FL=1